MSLIFQGTISDNYFNNDLLIMPRSKLTNCLINGSITMKDDTCVTGCRIKGDALIDGHNIILTNNIIEGMTKFVRERNLEDVMTEYFLKRRKKCRSK